MTSDDYNKIRTKDEEWLTKEQFGFFITTSEDLFSQKYKKKVIQLIEEFLEIMKPEESDLFRYGENANKYKNFNQKRFEEFKEHFLNFKDNDETLLYDIDIKKGCGKENVVGEFRIYIDISGLVKYFKKRNKGGGGHQIAFYIPKNLKIAENVLSLIKKYYKTLAKFFEPIYSPTWYGGNTGLVVEGNDYYKRFLR